MLFKKRTHTHTNPTQVLTGIKSGFEQQVTFEIFHFVSSRGNADFQKKSKQKRESENKRLGRHWMPCAPFKCDWILCITACCCAQQGGKDNFRPHLEPLQPGVLLGKKRQTAPITPYPKLGAWNFLQTLKIEINLGIRGRKGKKKQPPIFYSEEKATI